MLDSFGLGRSLEPERSLAQQAWRVDNQMELRRDELLIDVKIVSINLVSFSEIWEETGGDDDLLRRRVMEIIRERGKLHNPVTNTGGMLYGTVAGMGPDYPNRCAVRTGDEVISLVSLSITPLKLERICSVDYESAQLEVEGQAILYADSPLVRKPQDMPLRVAISAMDEAGAPACTHRIVRGGQEVLVLGASGRTGLLCGYAARDKMERDGKLVGVVRDRESRAMLEQYGLYDEVLVLDATDIERFCGVEEGGIARRFDVVINCINSANTEIASLVAVKNKGVIYFATLGCDYKFAGLTAESIGKEVRIIPYTGFLEGHADYTLGLLRRFPRMQEAIQQQFQTVEEERIRHERRERWEEDHRDDSANVGGYIFRSKESKATLRQALKVARYTSNVMIYGESGVGKEIIARIIHQNSERKSFPMIKINCAAIPENLLESELFGYEKGSFTGANAKGKMGLWEAAQNGTLFLDEVGELPLSFQAKLLRVIQEKEIVRVGGIAPIKVNVRIVAATNRDLAEMVQRGLFREDLYYRLNVYPITVQPLRKRRMDIVPLAEHFVERYNGEFGLKKTLSAQTLEFLANQPFRGNIRELQNLIQRLMITTDYQIIEVRDVLTALAYDQKEGRREHGAAKSPGAAAAPPPPADPEAEGTLKEQLARQEAAILRACKKKYGSTRKMAEQLGISQPSVVRKLNQYGIQDESAD